MIELYFYACQYDRPPVGHCTGLNYDWRADAPLALPKTWRLVDNLLVFRIKGEEVLSITPAGEIYHRGQLIAVDPGVAAVFEHLK